MSTAIDCTIRALAPDLADDYLGFFEGEAFADNPGWASCYCYFPHAPHGCERWADRTAAQNREAVVERIAGCRMHGYLAYADGRVVGWCNAAPRAEITSVDAGDASDAAHTGSIVCFIVAAAWRGRGIARQLLNAACEGFKEQGMKVAEAYPLRDAAGSAANHQGPLALYLAAGFEIVHEDSTGSMVVRRTL